MDEMLKAGFAPVVAYGSVGAITLLLKQLKNIELDKQYKLILFVGLTFIFGYVPADIGVDILNRIKVAYAGAMIFNAANTAINKVSNK